MRAMLLVLFWISVAAGSALAQLGRQRAAQSTAEALHSAR